MNRLAVPHNLGNPGKRSRARGLAEGVACVTGLVVKDALKAADLTFEEPANYLTTPFLKRSLAATPTKGQGRLEG